MFQCCCGSAEPNPDAIDNVLSAEVNQNEKPPEMKDEATPPAPLKRDPKHIISIVFKTQPLGLNFTSCSDGTSAYVTKAVAELNEAIADSKLPLDSKVLTVNGADVELFEFDDIIKIIMDGLKTLPLEFTFCHPDGLSQNEVPDPSSTKGDGE